VAQRNTEKTMF